MEACAVLFCATIGGFPPAGTPRFLEYTEYKLLPANAINGEPTRIDWSGWTAFRADGTYAGEKRLRVARYLAVDPSEILGRWVVHPSEGIWVGPSAVHPVTKCKLHEYRMPPSDAKCSEAAREYLPDFTFRGWRDGRAQYWNVQGATSRLVELEPKAGCEVTLWKAGFALMGVIVAPKYKYEVTKVEVGEPPARLFRRE